MRRLHAAWLTVAVAADAAQGQMLVSDAQRTVSAAWGRSGYGIPPSESVQYDTVELGSWYGNAWTSGAGARQTSDIRGDGFDFYSEGGSGGGAGHWAYATSSMVINFVLESDVAWELDRTFLYPMGMPSLTRLRDGANIFSGLSDVQSPLHASGYLEAGQYRYSVSLGMYNGPNWVTDTANFRVAVPAPASTMSLVAMALFAGRRRR